MVLSLWSHLTCSSDFLSVGSVRWRKLEVYSNLGLLFVTWTSEEPLCSLSCCLLASLLVMSAAALVITETHYFMRTALRRESNSIVSYLLRNPRFTIGSELLPTTKMAPWEKILFWAWDQPPFPRTVLSNGWPPPTHDYCTSKRS